MKKMSKATILCGLFISLLGVAPGAFGQATKDAEQAVIKLEQERVDALLQGDLATVERIFADDLIYTHSNGHVENRQQFLAAVKTGATQYAAMKHSDLKVQCIGDTALLRGISTIKGRTNGQPFNLQIRFLAVYVKVNGRWQMTTWQSTRLPAQ
ncbi:MAG: nuclear transport factor 2 family protein [Acidobacteria bacterium]|nr:nuclear transport factor 2 family protein [Acidobacteriota bacterium]